MRGRITVQSVLDQLLAERGIHRYALFLAQQEGKELPNGLESMSGFVLDSNGRVFTIWLDWDPEARQFVLDPFRAVLDAESEFSRDPEYRAARRRLGLP